MYHMQFRQKLSKLLQCRYNIVSNIWMCIRLANWVIWENDYTYLNVYKRNCNLLKIEEMCIHCKQDTTSVHFMKYILLVIIRLMIMQSKIQQWPCNTGHYNFFAHGNTIVMGSFWNEIISAIDFMISRKSVDWFPIMWGHYRKSIFLPAHVGQLKRCAHV